jgi:hypothetical protein
LLVSVGGMNDTNVLIPARKIQWRATILMPVIRIVKLSGVPHDLFTTSEPVNQTLIYLVTCNTYL